MELKKYISQSGMSIMSQAVLLVSNFVVFLLLVKTCTIEAFSAWAMFITIVSIIDTFRQGFINHTFIRSFVNNADNNASTIQNFIWVNYGFVALSSIFIILFSTLISDLFDLPGLKALLADYAYLAFALASLQFINTLFVAQRAYLKQLIFNAVYTFVLVATILTLWLFDALTPQSYIHVYFMLSLFIFIYLANESRFFRVLPSLAWLKQSYAYGKYTAGTSLLSLVFHKADILLIGYFLDPIAVSIFHFAGKIVNYCELPLNGISQVLFPKFTTCPKDEMARLYLLSGLGITLFMIPIIGFTYAFTDLIILSMGKADYLVSIEIIHYLLIASLIKPWGRVFGITLDAIGKPHINFQMLLLSVFINVALNLLFIPSWGIEGAAIATLFSITITIGIGQLRLMKYVSWNFHAHPSNWINQPSTFKKS